MASGVEGATFFTPTFILALGLPAEIAIGTGLITEVFGFASGLTAYARRRLIDYRLGGALLVVTIPMALVGTWVAGLVAAAILMLVAFDRISGLWVMPAMVILCREIMVSGLREFLAELRVSVPVSRLAKWKTTLQMLAISFLLLSDAGPAAIPVQRIGEIGLWVAAVLTIITGYDYLRAGLKHMTRQAGAEKGERRPAEPASVKPAQSPRPLL